MAVKSPLYAVPKMETKGPELKPMNDTIFETNSLNLWYGETQALKNVDLPIPEKSISAIIGPSGCGKSTFLKTLNRMVELIPSVQTTGEIKYKDTNILSKDYSAE